MKLAHLWRHIVSYNKPHCPPFEETLVARLLEQHSNARVASVTSHPIHHLIHRFGASFEHLAEVTIAFCEHAGDVEPTVADLRLPKQDLNIEFGASGRNLADVENSNKHRKTPSARFILSGKPRCKLNRSFSCRCYRVAQCRCVGPMVEQEVQCRAAFAEAAKDTWWYSASKQRMVSYR